jgi:hypothetical protein
MHRTLVALAIGSAMSSSLLLTGCATSRAHVSGSPDAATAAAFERLKSLAGEWEAVDDKGNRTVASVFAVTSGGSAVREVMFPGQPHEMTNMYHMDGSSIVATHYCAMGNQPRMRCRSSDGSRFDFAFDDITNLASSELDPMASMTLTIVADDRLEQRWSTLRADANHAPVFELTRKR